MISFYFDVCCPFAYLAWWKTRLWHDSLLFKPCLLGGIYDQTEAPQGQASASSIMAKAKQQVVSRDYLLQAKRFQLDIHWHPRHPVKSLLAQRLICAASSPADVRRVTAALFRAYWVENLDVDDINVLYALARTLDVSWICPLDRELFSNPRVSQILRENTAAVVKLGACGVPNFVTSRALDGSEAETLFWGADRLHFVESVQQQQMVPMPRTIPLAPLSSPTKLAFYWDFSSPWSYLAFTQIGRLQQELGDRLEIVHKPVLVGALFKAVGTPVVPSLATSPQKAALGAKDLQNWIYYWNHLPDASGRLHPFEFVFPSAFPLRTVLPLRVALLYPSIGLYKAVFEAAWALDLDIGNAAVLTKVLHDAGFGEAKEMVQNGSRSLAKELLFQNNNEAVQTGLCGVPTYLVPTPTGPAVVWGQDRVDLVMELLVQQDQARPAKL
ncbi:hypothetical protein HDV03_003211 [Kappamyces sp. JEL0829]|nr:hypothetical protein HDV03_003211 [Kappamyces sp. JEL0829]